MRLELNHSKRMLSRNMLTAAGQRSIRISQAPDLPDTAPIAKTQESIRDEETEGMGIIWVVMVNNDGYYNGW